MEREGDDDSPHCHGRGKRRYGREGRSEAEVGATPFNNWSVK